MFGGENAPNSAAGCSPTAEDANERKASCSRRVGRRRTADIASDVEIYTSNLPTSVHPPPTRPGKKLILTDISVIFVHCNLMRRIRPTRVRR